MRKEQVTCDVCGKQKQDTNHWFIVLRYNDDPTGIIVDVATTVSAYMTKYDLAFNFDVCGEACVLKKVSELISK